MIKLNWLERNFEFGLPLTMLPFYLERLQGTSARIEMKVKDIREEILSTKLDGKWSIKENIGHLADVDEIANKRIGEMLSGISPMTPAVIQPQKDYNKKNIAEVVRHFDKNRKKNLDRYKSLSDDDLKKFSLHPRLKVNMTPVDLAFFDAEHDDHHLVRISEIISALTTNPT